MSLQHLDTFHRYLEFEKRYSKHTVQAYLADVTAFLDFSTATYEIPDPTEIRHFHVRSWMVSLLEKDVGPRSVNRKLSSLRAYFRLLVRRGHATLNPMTKIQAPKSGKQLPSFVSHKSLDKLNSAMAAGDAFEAIRDRIVIEMLYGLGLRQAELVGLQVQDIDLKRMRVRVIGKRQKERIIPFGVHLAEILKRYARVREHMTGSTGGQLVLTDRGKPAYPKLIYRIVHKYLSLVSTIEKRSPHVLRHSFATHMLEAGANIEAIKELLGHSSLAATQVYTHTSVEKLKKTYRQAHPKA